jgi:hypothetical protein
MRPSTSYWQRRPNVKPSGIMWGVKTFMMHVGSRRQPFVHVTPTLPQDTSQRHPGLPGVLRHSVKLRTLPQDTSLRHPGYLGYCVTPSNYGLYRRIHGWDIQAYLGYCVTPSNFGLPRIHRRESVVRRAVGPRWLDRCRLHDSFDNDNVLFLEARLEVTSARMTNSCLSAFV